MAETMKKIEVLKEIAHRFNEAHVMWSLGASMLLYFKGITTEFHDIDLMIANEDVDVMAGFSIISDEKLFDCSLQEEQIVEKMSLGTEIIPLQSPLLWRKYYQLMGRNEKVKMIERALSDQ